MSHIRLALNFHCRHTHDTFIILFHRALRCTGLHLSLHGDLVAFLSFLHILTFLEMFLLWINCLMINTNHLPFILLLVLDLEFESDIPGFLWFISEIPPRRSETTFDY